MNIHRIVICLILGIGLWANQTVAQKGTLETIQIYSPALESNLIGDRATRSFGVYLPPSYNSSRWRYPVVLLLHGFGFGSGSLGDSAGRYDVLMNSGIPESILVFPDGSSRFGGSQYLSSEVVGDYATHITREIVAYVDSAYRTIPHRESRGIYGHSMGGFGSLKLALSHPEVLSVVVGDAGSYDLGFEQYRRAIRRAIPIALESDWDTLGDIFDFDPPRRDFLAYAAGTIPNPDNPPFFVDVPFVVVDGEIQEPTPGAWDRAWDRVVEHDVIREVERYVERPHRLNFIGFFHGLNDSGFDGGTVVEQARILDRKLTEMGIEHTYIEHTGTHSSKVREALPLMLPHLRTLPSGVPDIDQLSPGSLTALAGQPRDLNDLRITFAAPLEQGRLSIDASALGDRAEISFQRTSATEQAGSESITPIYNGRFFLPIVLETDSGDAYVAHRLQVDVFPAQDAVLFANDLGPTWSLDANRRVVPTPAAHDNRPGLALLSSGSWRVAFETDQPVHLFGYEGLRFAFHPANFALPEDRDPRLQVGTANLLEKIDLNLQQWQTVELTIEELGIPTLVPLQTLRFTGNLEGTFYLSDIRLVAQKPPANPGSTAVLEDYDSATPADISLNQNYPNPFNSSTVIRFALAQAQHIDLTIYNLAGQQVVTLLEGMRSPGQYAITWDGRDAHERALASGLYLYQLKAGDQVEMRKLLLLR